MHQPSESSTATIAIHQRMVVEVIGAMRNDVAASHTLETLAERACLSPFHFARVFRAVTGVPPNTFLTALRFEQAKRLLLESDMSVTDVCFEVGYGSLGTFTTRFRQLIGVSPQELRRLPALFDDVVDLRALDEPLAPASASRGARIDGVIHDPGGQGGPTYIGLFPNGLAASRPVAGTYLPVPGAFTIGPVPRGTYRLLAASLPVPTTDISAQLQPDSILFVAAAPDPVRVGAPGDALFRRLTLRPVEATDPPVLTALPALRLGSCPQLVQRARPFVSVPSGRVAGR